MFKMFLSFLLIITVFISLSGCSEDTFSKSLLSQKVEISRYLGTWYEIARIPNWFEKDLVGVTATYSLKKDGHLEVSNTGFLNTLAGEKKTALGDAWIPNPNESGRIKVSFFWPFAGDYIVIDLDENYQFALVGGGKDYLWILSRTPQLEEAVYERLLQKAKAVGYDTSRLQKVEQKISN